MLKNSKFIYGARDFNVPVKIHFGDFVLQMLLERKYDIAITNAETQESLTCGQMAQQAMNVAVSLTHLGIKKGEVVAVLSENRQEFHSTIIGVACTGAVVTTINTSYGQDELNHVMRISRPSYIFCSPRSYEMNEAILKKFKFKKIFIYGETQGNNISYKELSTTPNKWIQKDVSYSEFDVVDVFGQTDTLFILYSSGTTGLPKGVMVTHLNVISLLAFAFHPSRNIVMDNAVSLNITPWCHIMGLLMSLGLFHLRTKVVYLTQFQMKPYLDAIEKYKITQLVLVPSLLVALCNWNSNHDLSSVVEIYCGASPLHGDALAEARVRFPSLKVIFQIYGLTEAPVCKASGDINLAKPGSVGKVTGGLIVKIVDPKTREPLGAHQPGEICVKGFTLMKGYVGKNKADDFDEEGFFKTGDIGYYDEEQFLYIVDRLKDLIKYKGFQVSPVEIETILLQHEAVEDVGVVGTEDKVGGEVPVALVVLQPGKMVSEGELKDFVAKRLSHHKHLRGGVSFVEGIPRNRTGKILRRELKRMLNPSKSKL